MIEYKKPSELRPTVVYNTRIQSYMDKILAGEKIDPVILKHHGTRIKDGNHRAAAYRKLGMDIPTISEDENLR